MVVRAGGTVAAGIAVGVGGVGGSAGPTTTVTDTRIFIARTTTATIRHTDPNTPPALRITHPNPALSDFARKRVANV